MSKKLYTFCFNFRNLLNFQLSKQLFSGRERLFINKNARKVFWNFKLTIFRNVGVSGREGVLLSWVGSTSIGKWLSLSMNVAPC